MWGDSTIYYSGYRSIVKDCFPNAKITIDKFHVVKQMLPIVNRLRKEITGDKRKHPMRKLTLANSFKLEYWTRFLIKGWMRDNPALGEAYEFKERINMLYRCKGRDRAQKSFDQLLKDMKKSKNEDIKRVYRTLKIWEKEILNYFDSKLTNARVEGFNRVAKLVQRRGSGYTNFSNYRARVLNACC